MKYLLSIGIIWTATLFYFWRAPYLNELIISFLPYAIPFLLLGLAFHLYQLWRQLYKKQQFKISPVVFVLWFGLLFFLYSQEFTGFYNRKILTETPLQSPIRVLFANINKDNTNYDSIKENITREKPDILMLIEFDNHHKQELKEFLQEHYPHMSKNSRSRRFVGDIVFSKYPITTPPPKKTNEDNREYKYFSIDKEGTPYSFYLVHTSSPVSKRYFLKRNKQLVGIAQDIAQKETSPEGVHKSIILGDLNVAPWSRYYKDFATSLPDFQNITQALPFTFTWSLSDMFNIGQSFSHRPQRLTKTIKKVPLLWSHIDHAFTTKDLKIDNIKKIHISDSDHRGFVFDIE